MRCDVTLAIKLRCISIALLLFTGLIVLGACGGGQTEGEKASDALNRGLQAQAAGRIDEATAAYREALQHDPQNKFAYYNLGIIDRNAGRKDAAETNYRTALSIDPGFEVALFNLAILRREAGDNQESIALFRRAVIADPKDAAAHFNLGNLLLATGQKAEGDSEVQTALALDPSLATVNTPSPTPGPSGRSPTVSPSPTG